MLQSAQSRYKYTREVGIDHDESVRADDTPQEIVFT